MRRDDPLGRLYGEDVRAARLYKQVKSNCAKAPQGL